MQHLLIGHKWPVINICDVQRSWTVAWSKRAVSGYRDVCRDICRVVGLYVGSSHPAAAASDSINHRETIWYEWYTFNIRTHYLSTWRIQTHFRQSTYIPDSLLHFDIIGSDLNDFTLHFVDPQIVNWTTTVQAICSIGIDFVLILGIDKCVLFNFMFVSFIYH